MNRSDSIAELAKALSKAQGAMRNAVKDSDNPYFKSKYADLASVSDACRNELSVNGLAVVQLPTMRDGKVVLEYVLMHSSGEWIGSELEMTPVKSDPQGIGSAITYARRYTLSGIAGVATEDDDGNAASGNGGSGQYRNAKSVPVTTEETPLPKPRSAASNQAQGGNGTPTGRAKTQETEMERPQPDPPSPPPLPGADCIGEGQAKNFHIAFRNALRPALKKNAEELAHDYLRQKDIKDVMGKPSAYGIKKDSFYDVRDDAEQHASRL